MNKPTFYLIAALLSILTLTSCGDTPEKFIEDQAEHIEDLTSILSDYETGKISEREVVIEMAKWAAKWEEFDERLDKLEEDGNITDASQFYTSHKSTLLPPLEELGEITERIDNVGRFSQPMNNVLEKNLEGNKSFGHIFSLIFMM